MSEDGWHYSPMQTWARFPAARGANVIHVMWKSLNDPDFSWSKGSMLNSNYSHLTCKLQICMQYTSLTNKKDYNGQVCTCHLGITRPETTLEARVVIWIFLHAYPLPLFLSPPLFSLPLLFFFPLSFQVTLECNTRHTFMACHQCSTEI